MHVPEHTTEHGTVRGNVNVVGKPVVTRRLTLVTLCNVTVALQSQCLKQGVFVLRRFEALEALRYCPQNVPYKGFYVCFRNFKESEALEALRRGVQNFLYRGYFLIKER